MGQPKAPRHGSIQFWPRRRAKHSVARLRSWAPENKAKPLGFVGYKAGMTHLQVIDNRPRSLNKGEEVSVASTIIDCPPMTVVGVCFYDRHLYGLRKAGCVWSDNISKDLGRKIQLPKKKSTKTFDNFTQFQDLRLLVHSNPSAAAIGTKKPKLLEIALGGSKEEKLAYARQVLGKNISVEDVFEPGVSLDVHGITKAKGFQGTVKRFGVPIRQHKAEKTKRGIGTLGPWHPNRVRYSVPQSGKMGFHLRTEYNKQLLKVGKNGAEVTPNGGITKYGLVKNTYLLIRGSVSGVKKRPVVLTKSIRPDHSMTKEAPQIKYVSVKA
ncbi:MAG: 50S ribosomal protein L3 [Nanoarchaeota archaeon]|nr:50S ribosomal protein L3 [Nanoarchaeota archaeon]